MDREEKKGPVGNCGSGGGAWCSLPQAPARAVGAKDPLCTAEERTVSREASASKSLCTPPCRSGPYRWLARRESAGIGGNRQEPIDPPVHLAIPRLQ